MSAQPILTPREGLDAALHGLVWAFWFDEAGRPTHLDDDAVAGRIRSGEGWVWLHLNLTDNRAQDWIPDLPLDARSSALLRAADPRLQVRIHDGEISGVVSDFSLEFDGERSFEMGRLRFALTERVMVSARHHPLRTIERIREDFAGGRAVPDVAHVFELVVDGFLDAAHEDLEASSDEIDELEESVIAGRASGQFARTATVRRGLLRLRREIVHLRAALRPLEGSSVQSPSAGRLHKAVAFSAARLVARLDALYHDVHDLQDRLRLFREEVDSLAAAETNRQLYILSFLTAIFLPGTFITSMFGMNTKDLPLGQTDDGFWYAMLIVVGATALVLGLLVARLAKREGTVRKRPSEMPR